MLHSLCVAHGVTKFGLDNQDLAVKRGNGRRFDCEEDVASQAKEQPGLAFLNLHHQKTDLSEY